MTGLADEHPQQDDTDNITDRCLERFRGHYGPTEIDGAVRDIAKDDIWEYLYGVMHAPDWRAKHTHDLKRSLPRVPLADDFEAFRSAGRQLMDLHMDYESVPEHPAECLVDDVSVDSFGTHEDPEGAYRIDKLRWGTADGTKEPDRSVLEINPRCRIIGIPEEAHSYKVSGRSPLQWAIDGLRHKKDRSSGVTDDPNEADDWADEPFNLIRHLRRLIHVSVESTRIIGSLPPSL